MYLSRAVSTLARRTPVRAVAQRSFASSAVRRNQEKKPTESSEDAYKLPRLEDLKKDEDLIGPGAKPGTIPSDFEQATGLERFELLGKMQGVDVFNMKPLDASRLGTMEDPIIVASGGDEQYVGCTGVPADSHSTLWLTLSRDRPLERCSECGNCIKMEYVGIDEDHGHDDHHHHEGEAEPKTFADYVKPDYWYR